MIFNVRKSCPTESLYDNRVLDGNSIKVRKVVLLLIKSLKLNKIVLVIPKPIYISIRGWSKEKASIIITNIVKYILPLRSDKFKE